MSILKPIYTCYYSKAEPFKCAFGYAFDALVHSGIEFDAMAAWKSISERVSQGIYMGQGLLLPHTRIPFLKEPLMAFAVSPKGFSEIKTTNDELAQFLCVLLSPKESATAHTLAIANMAKLLLDSKWKSQALSATCNDEIKNLF